MSSQKRKVGFVTLVGRPNAGKSTFVNMLIGEKVSIVSKTPQTTQRPIRGIYTDEDRQIVFLDVPGFHESVRKWNQKLNDVVLRSLEDTDVILRLIDSTRPYGREEHLIDDILKQSGKPVVTVYSKVDDDRSKEIPKDSIRLSSETEEGVPDILTALDHVLPEGELLYDEEYYTDQDVFTRVSETVREKIFLRYRDEIPHSVYVDVLQYDDSPSLVRIEALIHCETESQKKILVGSGGENIKKVGMSARKDLEKLFEKKVYLGLRVKVDKSWRSNTNTSRTILGG